MNKCVRVILAAACCFASLSSASQLDKASAAKWVYLIKSPHAEIKKTKSGQLELIIGQIENSKIYMFNDRPFYLMREIRNVPQTWATFAKSNYRPTQKIDANIILGGHANEVRLSNFRLNGDKATYMIQRATKLMPLQTNSGPLILIIAADSRPLCSLMDLLRRDATSLNKLGT